MTEEVAAFNSTVSSGLCTWFPPTSSFRLAVSGVRRWRRGKTPGNSSHLDPSPHRSSLESTERLSLNFCLIFYLHSFTFVDVVDLVLGWGSVFLPVFLSWKLVMMPFSSYIFKHENCGQLSLYKVGSSLPTPETRKENFKKTKEKRFPRSEILIMGIYFFIDCCALSEYLLSGDSPT